MRRAVLATLIVGGLFLVYSVAHLALIELGREVVTLHKWTLEGTTRPTRLWIVDRGATAWFHHGDSESPWIARLQQDPIVTVERGGLARTYHAAPDPSSHAADVARRVPIGPWYRMAFNLGASATVGGPCHAAERPIR